MKLLIILVVLMAASCSAQKNSTNILPEKANGIYSFKINTMILQVDPEVGGRIISLQLDGKNFFTGKEVNAANWGSTFWPSPQKAWSNSSLAELDNKPYAATIEKNNLKMVSQKAPGFGFVFTKEISADKKSGSFTLKYTISNRSDIAKKVAPWEVSRVHPDGLAFYPKGTGKTLGNIAPLTEDKNGIKWFTYQRGKITASNNKFFSDGSEGWVAQVNDDVIFVKKFQDQPEGKAAPSEAEVELYTNADKSYVEIEIQGSYEELQPGASLAWEVTWFIRKLPASIKAKSGNMALVDYVRKLIK